MKLVIEIGNGQDPDIDIAGSDEFFKFDECEQIALINDVKKALDQYANRISLSSSFLIS